MGASLEQKNDGRIVLQSVDDVRRRFVAEGISIRAWATMRGYNPRTVYAVLTGQLACRYGISHQIAVDLGLKADPDGKHLAGSKG